MNYVLFLVDDMIDTLLHETHREGNLEKSDNTFEKVKDEKPNPPGAPEGIPWKKSKDTSFKRSYPYERVYWRGGDARTSRPDKRVLLGELKALIEESLNSDTGSKRMISNDAGRKPIISDDNRVVMNDVTNPGPPQAAIEGLPWARRAEQNTPGAFALPWKKEHKKRDLYKRLISDVNEIFKLSEKESKAKH